MTGKIALRTFRLFLLLLLSPWLVSSARGQSAQADTLADLLRQRTDQKAVILKNFSAEAKVHAQVDRTGVTFGESHEKSFSLVQFTAVKAHKQQITLSGTKYYLLRQGPHDLTRFPEEEPVTLVIEVDPALDPASLAAVVPQLFFSTVNEALDAIPKSAAALVPEPMENFQRDRSQPRQKPLSAPACDCSEARPTCPGGGAVGGLTPPVLRRQVDPRMPDGAPANTFWKTTAATTVQTDGTPGDIWMLHASNAGVAASAFQALRQYRFTPSACHGTPVEATLFIDTNFQNF